MCATYILGFTRHWQHVCRLLLSLIYLDLLIYKANLCKLVCKYKLFGICKQSANSMKMWYSFKHSAYERINQLFGH
jgi:hypothetical protein